MVILKILELLKNLFNKTESSDNKTISFKVKCNKCENINETKVLKSYDIANVYEDDQPGDYRLNKYIVCPDCYNEIHLEIFFDKNYQKVSSKCNSGELIE